jgi:hypothetical protein
VNELTLIKSKKEVRPHSQVGRLCSKKPIFYASMGNVHARTSPTSHVRTLEKLPIATVVAVSLTMESQVDWTRIDRVFRSHESKSNRCCESTEAYDDDVRSLYLHGH